MAHISEISSSGTASSASVYLLAPVHSACFVGDSPLVVTRRSWLLSLALEGHRCSEG